MIAKRLIQAPAPQIVQTSNLNTVKVLVASSEIKLGDSVRSADLKWQEWPKTATAAGYIIQSRQPKALSSFSGAIARAPFLSGEPIKSQKLIKASDGGVLAAILPAGMRAISTPIREETAAGGFILPNDRVDVIVTRRVRTSRREEHVSDTVLRNVRVLAIGQSIETKNGKKVANGKTATLELTGRQSEILALSQAMGEISLALRSLSDANPNARGTPQTSDGFGNSRGTTVNLLRYGIPSRAYGVN